jgi:hypothetical protein
MAPRLEFRLAGEQTAAHTFAFFQRILTHHRIFLCLMKQKNVIYKCVLESRFTSISSRGSSI